MAKKNTKEFWRKVVIWLMLIAMVGSLFATTIYAILS